MLDKIEQWHNKISDKYFIWFPFLKLKPKANQYIALPLRLTMTTCFTSYSLVFHAVRNYLNQQSVNFDWVVNTFPKWFFGFFIWFTFVTSFFWNRRAKRLNLKSLMLAFVMTFISNGAIAQTIETHKGVARGNDNKIAYIEEHEATFDNKGNIMKSKTSYKDSSGNLIGILISDFSKLITAPTYIYEDLRSGQKNGIRYTAKKLIMYRQEKGEKEEIKVIEIKEDNTLLVGCQGLHYYLRKNVDKIKKGQSIPISYIMPGALDFYKFKLRRMNRFDGPEINIKVSISNFFLRLFAPSLKVTYDSKTKKLRRYAGLSNIPDDSGNLQKVEIQYE